MGRDRGEDKFDDSSRGCAYTKEMMAHIAATEIHAGRPPALCVVLTKSTQHIATVSTHPHTERITMVGEGGWGVVGVLVRCRCQMGE